MDDQANEGERGNDGPGGEGQGGGKTRGRVVKGRAVGKGGSGVHVLGRTLPRARGPAPSAAVNRPPAPASGPTPSPSCAFPGPAPENCDRTYPGKTREEEVAGVDDLEVDLELLAQLVRRLSRFVEPQQAVVDQDRMEPG